MKDNMREPSVNASQRSREHRLDEIASVLLGLTGGLALGSAAGLTLAAVAGTLATSALPPVGTITGGFAGAAIAWARLGKRRPSSREVLP